MKEITILSGKGGTGKTSITAALATITRNAVFCDNDVNAADLHLIFQPEIHEINNFDGSWIAMIDHDRCTKCGICITHCRFNAIYSTENGYLKINPFHCEGCRLCEKMCPVEAINSERNNRNEWYVSMSRFGILVHAKMAPGQENSGKLVTEVRKKAKEIATENDASYLLNDGPPGIGCPTIASLSGTDIVLIVTEPTKTGLHDISRLTELIQSFNIQAFAIINKYDINHDTADKIEAYLVDQKIRVLAKIPFKKEMVESMVECKSIIEYNPESEISKKIKELWDSINTTMQ